MSKYIIYCRKSTESEDRQVLSIESQTRELFQLAEKLNIEAAETITESKSAKKPGRPGFNAVMQQIENGQIRGILCWKLDRLARNAFDGGRIIQAITDKGLKIITPSQTYDRDNENSILAFIEFGFAQKYVEDLSKNVKRGLRTKAQNGWYPATPPPGYRTVLNPNGEKTIERHPELFEPVKDLWDSILYNSMSVEAARIHVAQKWRLASTRKCPLKNRTFCKSTVYRMLNNPFYMGVYEFPLKSGKVYEGKHEPMVSKDEFETVQAQLAKMGRVKKRKRRDFPYAGLIQCGECHGKITYEEKHQIICGRCRTKFAEGGRKKCPGCSALICRMPTVKRLVYRYCHCTGRKNGKCSQRSIKLEELESQMLGALREIAFSKEFIAWLDENVESIISETASVLEEKRRSLERGLKKATTALGRLVQLFTSVENADHSLLRPNEYVTQRKALVDDERRLSIALKALPPTRVERYSALKETAEFAALAPESFAAGTSDACRVIVERLYSTLLLSDKHLTATPRFALQTLQMYQREFQRDGDSNRAGRSVVCDSATKLTFRERNQQETSL